MLNGTFKGIMAIIIPFLVIISYNSYSQNDCKVLMKEISQSYSGKCKKGLAHGIGVAKGVDVYEGRFKSGFPHGRGKYTWANGNYYDGSWKNGKKSGKGELYIQAKDSTLKGIWKNDGFYKKLEERPYEITTKTGISGVSFYQNETSSFYKVEIVFQRDGRQTRSIDGVMLWGSSGFTKSSSGFTGFENISFPFEGSIKFEAANRYNSAIISSELDFIIKKPSSWKIVIKY